MGFDQRNILPYADLPIAQARRVWAKTSWAQWNIVELTAEAGKGSTVAARRAGATPSGPLMIALGNAAADEDAIVLPLAVRTAVNTAAYAAGTILYAAASGDISNTGTRPVARVLVQSATVGVIEYSPLFMAGVSGMITGAMIVDGTVLVADIGTGAVDTDELAADAVDGAKIADDSIDSEHYVDGSIDLAHLSADCVDGTKIADDAVDSEHYAAASIDWEHMATDVLRVASGTIAAAAVQILNGTPVTVVAAPAAGFRTEVVKAVYILRYGTTQYDDAAATDYLQTRYTDGSGLQITSNIAGDTFGGATVDTIAIPNILSAGIAALSAVEAQAVVAYISAGNWYNLAGDSAIEYYITYRTVAC